MYSAEDSALTTSTTPCKAIVLSASCKLHLAECKEASDTTDFPNSLVNIYPDSLCARWTSSAVGFLFIALIAFLAAIWVLTNNPSQKYACRSRSIVLDSRRAMSPASSEESFTMSDQPAHASITPAPFMHHLQQASTSNVDFLPVAASVTCTCTHSCDCSSVSLMLMHLRQHHMLLANC